MNASGRTDSGVHAVGQVANFRTDSTIPADALARALNATLPHDIAITARPRTWPEFFDANRDAVRKLYRYVIFDGPVPSPFLRKYVAISKWPLDAQAMSAAARCLVGTHDFRCFETEWPNRATSVRTITHLAVNRFGEHVWIDVEADGFNCNNGAGHRGDADERGPRLLADRARRRDPGRGRTDARGADGAAAGFVLDASHLRP